MVVLKLNTNQSINKMHETICYAYWLSNYGKPKRFYWFVSL